MSLSAVPGLNPLVSLPNASQDGVALGGPKIPKIPNPIELPSASRTSSPIAINASKRAIVTKSPTGPSQIPLFDAELEIQAEKELDLLKSSEQIPSLDKVFTLIANSPPGLASKVQEFATQIFDRLPSDNKPLGLFLAKYELSVARAFIKKEKNLLQTLEAFFVAKSGLSLENADMLVAIAEQQLKDTISLLQCAIQSNQPFWVNRILCRFNVKEFALVATKICQRNFNSLAEVIIDYQTYNLPKEILDLLATIDFGDHTLNVQIRSLIIMVQTDLEFVGYHRKDIFTNITRVADAFLIQLTRTDKPGQLKRFKQLWGLSITDSCATIAEQELKDNISLLKYAIQRNQPDRASSILRSLNVKEFALVATKICQRSFESLAEVIIDYQTYNLPKEILDLLASFDFGDYTLNLQIRSLIIMVQTDLEFVGYHRKDIFTNITKVADAFLIQLTRTQKYDQLKRFKQLWGLSITDFATIAEKELQDNIWLLKYAIQRNQPDRVSSILRSLNVNKFDLVATKICQRNFNSLAEVIIDYQTFNLSKEILDLLATIDFRDQTLNVQIESLIIMVQTELEFIGYHRKEVFIDMRWVAEKFLIETIRMHWHDQSKRLKELWAQIDERPLTPCPPAFNKKC